MSKNQTDLQPLFDDPYYLYNLADIKMRERCIRKLGMLQQLMMLQRTHKK